VLLGFPWCDGGKAAERWPNLTLKKIPKMVLARCEWGHDDYSLNVANLPMAEREGRPEAADVWHEASRTQEQRKRPSRTRDKAAC
jgi:adenine-specific DNA-methyltransferase